jgi:hypothetical protein
MRRFLRLLLAFLRIAFRLPFALLRAAWRITVPLAFVALLALNVLTLTSDVVNAAVSRVVEAVTGEPSVASRHTSTARRNETRARRAETDLKTAKADLARAQENFDRSRSDASKLRSERDSARQELRESKKQFRAERQRMQANVRKTTGSISRRARKLGVGNIAAIGGEAIPIVGFGFILGMTTWEITETCSMMQEAHELAVAFEVEDSNDPARMEACGFELPSPADLWARVCSDKPALHLEAPADMPQLKIEDDSLLRRMLCRSVAFATATE